MAINRPDLKVSDAKATVTDKLKSAWATITTISNPFSKDKITANTGSTAVNKAVEKVVNSPITKTVIAGGLVAGGTAAVIKTAPLVSSAVASSGSKSVATTVSSKVATSISASSAIKYGLVGAGVGYIAGSLGKGSATAKSDQNVAPQFTPTQDTTVTPSQYVDNTQNTSTWTQNTNYGSGSINSVSSQDPTLTSTPTQETNTIPTFTPTQDTSADQTTSASGSNNVGLLIAAAAAIYLLSSD